MKKIAFVWENFGPGHIDRCEAAVNRLQGQCEVVGIELFQSSETYLWAREDRGSFDRRLVFPKKTALDVNVLRRFFCSFKACAGQGFDAVFLCHYEKPATLMLAVALRCLGTRVFVMNDSKFDDYPRKLFREFVKFIYYLPYSGGLASGFRSADYMRFLGVRRTRIETNYNAISHSRIQALAARAPHIETIAYADRYWIVIARLIQKKNLFITLDAFAEYSTSANPCRQLHIVGSGPLLRQLQEYADSLGIGTLVIWHGFLQTDRVSGLLAGAVGLLLLSSEEQFGNVVIEAQALAIPCIVSVQVGARDLLVRSAVTGFVVEPDNSSGAAKFMALLGGDECRWLEMRKNILSVNQLGDASNFADAVRRLVFGRNVDSSRG
jgi:glycosyltransferase involved in cell wall biosynthesis